MKNIFFTTISILSFGLASCGNDDGCVSCFGTDSNSGLEINSEACEFSEGVIIVSGGGSGGDTVYLSTLEEFKTESIATGLSCGN